MKAFLELVRDRFTKVDLMHLVDIDDENLQSLIFQNGPSRDEFIKVLVYKLLLDTDPESEYSNIYDLEYIFVSFGLLDKVAAQNFLKGNMSTKVHTATWKKMIESLIPTTTVAIQYPSYDELMNNIYEKSNYFRSAEKKNYLPPELISKLKVETELNENKESIDDISDQLIRIINKPIIPNEHSDFKTYSNCEEQSPDISSKCMDLISVKKEVDQCIQISNNKNITPLNNEGLIKMTTQEFLELIDKKKLIHTDNLESKIEYIHKLMKAEQDLQILADSLIVQYNVSQHIKTDKHQKNVKRKNEQAQRKVQQLLTNQNSVKSDFNMDLCQAMVSANIPLNKLSNNVFRTILEKYTGKSIPMEATLRKGYIDDIFNSTLDNMKMEIQQNKIWVSIDETCDVEGRFIANVVVGILRPDCPGRIFLLHSEQLDKANHSTICKLFDKAMGIIWPGNIKIAEQIRGQFGTVDELISNMKKIFRKAPYRVEMFKLEAPGIKLPPEPIITHENDADSIRKVKLCIIKPGLETNLAYIKSNFEVLIKAIIELQKKNVLLSDSLAVVQNVQQKFSLLKGNHGKPVLTKLQTVF
ncbi:hypothetical protein QTP88_024859 [Uroleucon formosanum]